MRIAGVIGSTQASISTMPPARQDIDQQSNNPSKCSYFTAYRSIFTLSSITCQMTCWREHDPISAKFTRSEREVVHSFIGAGFLTRSIDRLLLSSGNPLLQHVVFAFLPANFHQIEVLLGNPM
jgi:hypothetical protein